MNESARLAASLVCARLSNTIACEWVVICQYANGIIRLWGSVCIYRYTYSIIVWKMIYIYVKSYASEHHTMLVAVQVFPMLDEVISEKYMVNLWYGTAFPHPLNLLCHRIESVLPVTHTTSKFYTIRTEISGIRSIWTIIICRCLCVCVWEWMSIRVVLLCIDQEWPTIVRAPINIYYLRFPFLQTSYYTWTHDSLVGFVNREQQRGDKRENLIKWAVKSIFRKNMASFSIIWNITKWCKAFTLLCHPCYPLPPFTSFAVEKRFIEFPFERWNLLSLIVLRSTEREKNSEAFSHSHYFMQLKGKMNERSEENINICEFEFIVDSVAVISFTFAVLFGSVRISLLLNHEISFGNFSVHTAKLIQNRTLTDCHIHSYTYGLWTWHTAYHRERHTYTSLRWTKVSPPSKKTPNKK